MAYYQGYGATSQSTSTPYIPQEQMDIWNYMRKRNEDAYNQISQGYNQRLSELASGYSGLGQNILAGLTGSGNQQMDWLTNTQNQILQGYGNLTNQVLGDMYGVGDQRSQDIADYYTSQGKNAVAGLINRGLGNQTIQASILRGIGREQQQAQNRLREDIGERVAGLRANLGAQTLGYQNQANMQQQAQMQWLADRLAGYSADIGKTGLAAGMQGYDSMTRLLAGLTPQVTYAPMGQRTESSSFSPAGNTNPPNQLYSPSGWEQDGGGGGGGGLSFMEQMALARARAGGGGGGYGGGGGGGYGPATTYPVVDNTGGGGGGYGGYSTQPAATGYPESGGQTQPAATGYPESGGQQGATGYPDSAEMPMAPGNYPASVNYFNEYS